MAYLLPFYTDYENIYNTEQFNTDSKITIRGQEYTKYKLNTSLSFYIDNKKIEENIYIFKNENNTNIEEELKLIKENILDCIFDKKKNKQPTLIQYMNN